MTQSDTTQRPILVIGGTGLTGSRVTAQLRERGHRARVASRSSEWRFDWQDRDTWEPVLHGVESMYVVQYDPEPLTSALVERAAAHGVARIVLLSGRGVDDPDYIPELSADEDFVSPLLAGEWAVRDGGLDWTILRPGWFAQNLSEGVFGDNVRSGQVRLPTDEGKASWIDTEDIAAVAVAALTEPGHHGRIYELSGPRALGLGEVAAEISESVGRPISYVPVSVEEYVAEQVANGWSEDDARGLALALSPIRRGADAQISGGVREALGREPRDFTDFVKDAAASGIWDRRPQGPDDGPS